MEYVLDLPRGMGDGWAEFWRWLREQLGLGRDWREQRGWVASGHWKGTDVPPSILEFAEVGPSDPGESLPTEAPLAGEGGVKPETAIQRQIVLGWLGGRAMEWTKDAGYGHPASHFAIRDLLVDTYTAATDTEPATLKLKSMTRVNTQLGLAAQRVYLGPGVKPRGSNSYTKWWDRTSDWTAGLPLVIYEQADASNLSGSGGQYTYVRGRSQSNSRTLVLERPFAVAPVEDDVVAIGPQVFWAIWGSQVARPLGTAVDLESGQVVVRRLRGDTGMWIEVYRSGQRFQIATPGFPFRPGTVRHTLSRSDVNQPYIKPLGRTDGSGVGVRGYEFSVATIFLLQRGENVALEELSYVALHSDGRAPGMVPGDQSAGTPGLR